MKSLGKSLLKGLLVATLFTSGTIALSTFGLNTVNQVEAATYNQVSEYLISNGYTVCELNPARGYDWLATTIKDGKYYHTIVYCTQTSVVAHTDNPI